MSVNSNDDFALLHKAASFDQGALAEIYDRYQAALYRYAYRLLGDEQLAEDCISETFYRFLKNLRKGGVPKTSLRAYLYRIAHNWITDFYRRPINSSEQKLDESLPSSDNPEEVAMQSIQRDRVREAILALTLEQQQALILHHFEGWPNEEIANCMGKRVGAVKALLHRSIVALKKKLE